MTLFEFQLLSIPEMVSVLYEDGVYIGKRKAARATVLLYQLESFYIELFYTEYRKTVSSIRSSASTHLLDPYLEQIPVESFVLSAK